MEDGTGVRTFCWCRWWRRLQQVRDRDKLREEDMRKIVGRNGRERTKRSLSYYIVSLALKSHCFHKCIGAFSCKIFQDYLHIENSKGEEYDHLWL